MANTKKTSNSTKKSTSNSTTKKTNVKTTKKVDEVKKNETTKKVEQVKKPEVNKKVEEIKKPETVTKEKKTSTKTEKVKVVVPEKNDLKGFFKENSTMLFLCAICVLLIINIIMIALGHKAKLSNGKEIIASLDGKNITVEEVYEEIKEIYGTNALINMVDEFIINKEIKDQSKYNESAKEQVESIKTQYAQSGYKWEDVLANYGYNSDDDLLKEVKLSLLQEEVIKNYLGKDITDEEINTYYEKNIYGDYTAKHILIMPDTTEQMTDDEKAAAEELAKNTAIEVINKLNAGTAWTDLVKEYSDDEGSVEEEGLIENFTKGDVVDEFFNAVLNLNNGSYTTEPVKSTYGYHVILKVSNTEKEKLEEVKDEIISSIINEKLTNDKNLYNTTWANIRKTYNFKINDTVIENKYNATIKGE